MSYGALLPASGCRCGCDEVQAGGPSGSRLVGVGRAAGEGKGRPSEGGAGGGRRQEDACARRAGASERGRGAPAAASTAQDGGVWIPAS